MTRGESRSSLCRGGTPANSKEEVSIRGRKLAAGHEARNPDERLTASLPVIPTRWPSFAHRLLPFVSSLWP